MSAKRVRHVFVSLELRNITYLIIYKNKPKLKY